MKTDCFHVYSGFPVAIVKLLPDNKAEVRHIYRSVPEKIEIVACDDLIELTQQLAVSYINKLCKLRDQAASKYNVVIRAYEECMGYM